MNRELLGLLNSHMTWIPIYVITHEITIGYDVLVDGRSFVIENALLPKLRASFNVHVLNLHYEYPWNIPTFQSSFILLLSSTNCSHSITEVAR